LLRVAQERLKQRSELVGKTFGFVGEGGAGVLGFGFDERSAVLIENAVAEVQANFFSGGEPKLDRELVVVASGRFITETTFDDGKDGVLLLKLGKWHAEMAEEFAAGGFEQVEVARVIDVIADGAVGVSHAVSVAIKLTGHWESLEMAAGE
jgi:hypothetical protein